MSSLLYIFSNHKWWFFIGKVLNSEQVTLDGVSSQMTSCEDVKKKSPSVFHRGAFKLDRPVLERITDT